MQHNVSLTTSVSSESLLSFVSCYQKTIYPGQGSALLRFHVLYIIFHSKRQKLSALCPLFIFIFQAKISHQGEETFLNHKPRFDTGSIEHVNVCLY